MVNRGLRQYPYGPKLEHNIPEKNLEGIIETAEELYEESMREFIPFFRYETRDSLVIVHMRKDSVFFHRDLASAEPIAVPGYIRIERYSKDRSRIEPISTTDYQILPEKLPKMRAFSSPLDYLGRVIPGCEGSDYAIEIKPDMDPLLELYFRRANGIGRGDA